MIKKLWFPLTIALLFGFCVLFKLNGSSVGVWDDVYGNGSASSESRLLFKPQQVRSDEWEVWTPAALSQSRQIPPFPLENFSLGGGKAPLLFNLPVRHYTALFRPQLWGFFVFDFERGFSFLWWMKIFGLLLAGPWFFRQLGIQSRGVALFGALVIILCLQWWWSSPAMVPEMYATWAICAGCAIRFLIETNRWRLGGAFIAFVYCGVNFLLCLYPPAQIPLLLLFVVVFTAVFLERRDTASLQRGALILGVGVASIALILVPFWVDIRSTLEIVSHTVYPGARRHSGGTFSIFKLFSGIVSFFESEKAFPRIFANVCEAHHMFLFWPMILFTVVVARIRQRIAIPPLMIPLGIFVIGLTGYFLIALPEWLLMVTGLRFSHPRGVTSGLFMADVCLTCIFLDRYRGKILTKQIAIGAALAFCAAVMILVWRTNVTHPGIFPDWKQIAFAIAADVILIVLFFFDKRRVWLPIALLMLMALSNIWINPLMSGLSPILDSEIFQTVARVQAKDPDAKWIVYDGLELSELIRATGAKVLGGTRIVPDLDLMRPLDPDNRAAFIYNRYAHLLCHVPQTPGDMAFALIEQDLYQMEIDPSLPVIKEMGVRYLVFPKPWAEAESYGFAVLEKVGGTSILIYRRQ